MKSILCGCIAVITCLIFTIQSHAKEIPNAYVSNERKLYRHLLDGYEKTVRPVKNESETVQLSVDLEIIAIEDLEEANQAFYAIAWLRMSWSDFQLSWNPADFGGVEMIRLPASELWLPDLAIVNSLDAEMRVSGQSTLAVVDSTGNVLLIPAIYLRTHCPVDLSRFPFDEHTCQVKMSSWTYAENMVNVTKWTIEDFQQEVQTGEWLMSREAVTRNVIKYDCCPERYVDLTFSFTMKRTSTFATHLFVAPSITLSLIIPVVFILPPTSSHKMTMGGAVLLAHVLLLGEFIKYVPSEHPNVPLIARFFLANIVLVSLALTVSALVINIWERGSRIVRPPAFLRAVFLNDIVTKLTCMNYSDTDDAAQNYTRVIDNDHSGSIEVMSDLGSSTHLGRLPDDTSHIVNRRQSISASKLEWFRLATAVDRVFLLLYLIVIVGINLGYIGYF